MECSLNTWSEGLELSGTLVVISEGREVLAACGQRHCQVKSHAVHKRKCQHAQVNDGTLNE